MTTCLFPFDLTTVLYAQRMKDDNSMQIMGLVWKRKYSNLIDTIEDEMRVEMSTICQVHRQQNIN